MDFGISSKTAFVSGGSKGIGNAISRDLGAEGCNVVVAARGQEAIDETVDQIKSEGGTAVGISADLTKREDIERAVQFTRDTFGPPEIAVTNVYGPTHGLFDETNDEDFREAYEHIVMSVVDLSRAVIPDMKEKGWGRLVNIGSICAKEPHRALPLVTANVTRVGVVALNKSLSAEVGPFGITVNTLATGGFFTDRYKDYMANLAAKRGENFNSEEAMRSEQTPVGRLGYPEEMAAVCTFLCSTRASYVTGQMIVVDGGRLETLW